jgi:Methane oxygenase PmoA
MRWACVATVVMWAAVAGGGSSAGFGTPAARAGGVEVKVNEAAKRVDVTIDGKPFTSYIWPDTLKKPVLYPLRTAKGTLVTRGFPLDPRKGERVDHPHHVGMWLNHGDVNGLDFWNNSDAIPAAQAPKMGTIYHRKIIEAKSGATQGELTVETAWMAPDHKQLIKETTRFVFRGDAGSRTIDRTTTLTALDQKVVFKDSKEAFFGMRVTRALEQPAEKAEVFTDASGKATPVPVLDNTGVTGKFVSSEGKEGDAVWSTRGKWTLLGGTIDGEPVTLAILDHPSNVGYPTHWHARGYGLFAANPLGDKQLNEPKAFDFTLEAGASVTFKYRVLILGSAPSVERIERESKAFAQDGSSSPSPGR